jgi:hypothetical protein
MCDCLDLPQAEFYNEEIVRARREHKCCECRRPIRKGEVYQRANGKWDGDFASFATCNACLVIWRSVRQLGACHIFGGLSEEISMICRYWDNSMEET